ncbi:MAG: cytochrome-c oxidase, cbb3-type subunit III [Rhodomicrobium sp.]
MADNRDIDHHSGVETTGHEWDGLKELNNPLPRWWILVFYACIVWAIGYWVAFPAWPMLSGYTKGMLGYSERAAVNAAVAADMAAQSKFTDLIAKESVTEVNANPELLKFSMTAGRAAFVNNCAGCHGSGAQGNPGYPNLNDDNWLWGGTLDQIQQTIMYGVRNGSDQARGGGSTAGMPERASVLKPDQINDVAEYVLSLSKRSTDAAAAERGKAIFSGDGGCNACHGDDAKGNQELGSDNLTAGIFQWGGTKADIVQTITNGRAGVMPVWAGKLSPATIKELAVYVHSLGGGQ